MPCQRWQDDGRKDGSRSKFPAQNVTWQEVKTKHKIDLTESKMISLLLSPLAGFVQVVVQLVAEVVTLTLLLVSVLRGRRRPGSFVRLLVRLLFRPLAGGRPLAGHGLLLLLPPVVVAWRWRWGVGVARARRRWWRRRRIGRRARVWRRRWRGRRIVVVGAVARRAVVVAPPLLLDLRNRKFLRRTRGARGWFPGGSRTRSLASEVDVAAGRRLTSTTDLKQLDLKEVAELLYSMTI